MTVYKTIVADPPWPYGNTQPVPASLKKNGERASGVSSVRRYGSMPLDAIEALRPEAEDNAHLYLWTTNAFMVEAHAVARAWGFKPRTICTWGKVQADGRASSKTGYYFRGATEHVVFAVRGSLRLQVTRAIPTLWLWPRLPHSVKPDAFYDLVEECSPGPYLEMFARRQRLGWETWGDQALEHAKVA